MRGTVLGVAVSSAVLERFRDRVYRVRDRFVNLYVVDAGSVVLVDAETRTAGPRICAGLRELGKEVEDIAYVPLTHHHPDHVGTAGVWELEAGADEERFFTLSKEVIQVYR